MTLDHAPVVVEGGNGDKNGWNKSVYLWKQHEESADTRTHNSLIGPIGKQHTVANDTTTRVKTAQRPGENIAQMMIILEWV